MVQTTPSRKTTAGRPIASKDQPVALPDHPVMRENPMPEIDSISEPYRPRANLAVSQEKPEGSTEWASKHSDKSVLEQHVAFFERSEPGVIWPLDTYRGFAALGFSVALCILSVFVIHSGFSYPTQPPGHWLPDPRFRIYTAQIHRAKHGSDSGTYDSEGRFVPSAFEKIFSRYDHDGKGGLTLKEMAEAIAHQRQVFDFFGWLGVTFEALATYLLIWPADGVVSKEELRKVYDGSIFEEIETREKQRSQGALSGLKKTNRRPNPK